MRIIAVVPVGHHFSPLNFFTFFFALHSLPFIPGPIRPVQIKGISMSDYSVYMCVVCGFVYNEEEGLPEEGFPPGTRWADIPANWVCPECGASKDEFEMVEI